MAYKQIPTLTACVYAVFFFQLLLSPVATKRRSDSSTPGSGSKAGRHQSKGARETSRDGPSIDNKLIAFGKSGTARNLSSAPSDFKSHTFLNEYVLKSNPLYLPDHCRHFPAIEGWKVDGQLITRPQSFTTWVNVKDEALRPREVTFRNFLKKYMTSNWCVDDETPAFMWEDVYLPTCILCVPLLKQLSQSLLWYSGLDGFNPVEKREIDSVKCVISGTAQITLVDPTKFSDKMPEDLSSIDVTNVNLDRFPGLREVEFIRAEVTTGDCVYLPAHWYQQVNTLSRTIAVDVTFRRPDRPVSKSDCRESPSKQELHQYTFQDQVMEKPSEESIILHHFLSYISDNSVFSFEKFLERLKKDVVLTNITEWTEEFHDIAQELFQSLDVTANGKYSVRDLAGLTPQLAERLGGLLLDRVKDFRDIIDDQQDDKLDKPEKTLDPNTLEFINDYVSELESVLVNSVDQYLKTGVMPDIESKMASMDAKQKIGLTAGDSSTKAGKHKEDAKAEHYTSREDAKAKLKAIREKKEAEKAASLEVGLPDDEVAEAYEYLDDTEEEEILAEEETEQGDARNPEVRKPDKDGKIQVTPDPVGSPESASTVKDGKQFEKVEGEKVKTTEDVDKKENKGEALSANEEKVKNKIKPGKQKPPNKRKDEL